MTDAHDFEVRTLEAADHDSVRKVAGEMLCRELDSSDDLRGEDDLVDIGLTYGPPDNRMYVAESDGSGFTTSQWGGWSTGVSWDEIHVGNFDGSATAPRGAAASAADQFWSEVGNGNEEDDSLILENLLVDLLKMEE